MTLITSKQTQRELYTLTVSNVNDAWGNRMASAKGVFGGMASDSNELNYTVKGNGNEIIVTYNRRVDAASAEDVFNYDLDDALGYAARAELDDSGRVVTLLTAEQSGGKIYTITISNVKDTSGNKISASSSICTKKFAGVSGSSESSNGSLNLDTVITVNVNTIDLVFSDKLTEDELDDLAVEVTVPAEYDYELPSNLDYYKYFVDGKKNVRIQFKTRDSKNPEIFERGNVYEVEVLKVDRLNTKSDSNIKMFAGTNILNEAPEVLSVEAINSTAVLVTFSEPVKGVSKSQFEIRSSISLSGVSVEEIEITDKVILYLSSTLKDTEYKLYVKSGIRDAVGLNSVDLDNDYIEFDGTSETNKSPYIESDITVINSFTLQFVFNEEIKDITSSSFTVKKSSGGSIASFSIANAVLQDDRKTVILYLSAKNTGLESDYSYKLVVNNSVKDLQGLGVDSDDREQEFDGEDIALEKLEIISAYIDGDNSAITLVTNRDLKISSLGIDDFELSGAGYSNSTSDKVVFDDNTITIRLKNALDSDEELAIKFTTAAKGKIRDYNSQSLTTDKIEVDTN